MSLTVETGAIVASSNTYTAAATLTAYAAARGITLVSGEETLLIQAMDYLETLSFIGTKYTAAQTLQWPRTGAYIDGFAVDIDEIPSELPIAQMTIALAIDAGNGPLTNIARSTKRERVGEIEVEYMDGANSVTIVRTINAQLWKLLNSGGMRVSKA